MPNELRYLAMLQWEIEGRHECEAVHRESVVVHETLNGDTIWKGQVEIFYLVGHAKATTCYAWAYLKKDKEWVVRLITVLGTQLMDSPQKAVRAAIFHDMQSAPMHNDGPRINAA